MGERLQQRHGERDVEVERWRGRVAQLLERWQAVLAQTDLRQRELEQLGRQLRYYRESADPLAAWLQDAKQRQEQIQAVPLADSRAVREQLRQEKALLEEIERHGEKVEECQKFAKQYINAIKVRLPPFAAFADAQDWQKPVGVQGPGEGWLTSLSHRTTSSSWSRTRRSLSQWPPRPRSRRSNLGLRVSSRSTWICALATVS